MSDVTIDVTVTQGGTIDADLSSGTVINASVEQGGQLAAEVTGGGVGPQGEKGDKGDTGDTGATGPQGDPGEVQTLVAGNNIDVDSSDPNNPIISVETLFLADITDITASPTELNYSVGVTSAIQTQFSNKQPLDSDLTAIAALTPTNDDVIQRKAGAWTNRTPAQLKTDLALVKGDVGLGNVDNTADAVKNVLTAATLFTARTIDGQSFDGSTNITVIAPGTHAATSKGTPVDADELPLVDSAASNVLKRLTWANLKATLKTYFDTLYQATGSYQPLDSDLTTIAGLTATTDNFLQAKSSAWASRTPAQVLADLAAVGTTFQPLDSDLTTIAGLTPTTDNFMVATASAWASRTPTQARSQLGLGSIALLSTITEANITLADNTTNNFTTSAHGFVPKGTNVGNFLKDDGSWAAIPGGGDALTSNPLSQFASTTSLQLKGVMSDETGSGALVFANSPALVTPTGIVKGDVGLGNVDNTSDSTKNAAAVSLTNKVLSDVTLANTFQSLSGLARDVTLTASTDFEIDSVLDVGSTGAFEIPATSTLDIVVYIQSAGPDFPAKVLRDTYMGDIFDNQGPTSQNLVLDVNKDFMAPEALEIGAGVSFEIPLSTSLEIITYAPPTAGNPIGTILPYGGATSPAGYLLCQGQAVSRTVFAGLFAVLGTAYGTGDGSTTFNVPDLRGRSPIGAGTGTATGATAQTLGSQPTSGVGGEQTHVLTIAELASHTHPVTDNTWNNTGGTAGAFGNLLMLNNTGNHNISLATTATGSDAAHNILSPVSVVNFIIKI